MDRTEIAQEQEAKRAGVSRRGFLKLAMTAGLGLVATGFVDPVFAWADGTGLSRDDVKARFLIGSDLHVTVGIGGTEPRDADKKLEFALDAIYKIDPQLDAFCLVGDVTDNGTIDQYKHLMQLVDDNVKEPTQAIICQGNHETYSWGVQQAREVFEEQTGQAANQVVDVNGVRVITMGPWGSSDGDYRGNYDWFVQQLEEQGCNDKVPFLVLTHHQMQGTSYTSPEWHGNFGQGGNQDFAKLMGRYPNLVQVSGHSHATLEDERSISQDLGFTAIQDSTIGAYYENETGKVDPTSGDGASVPPQTADIYTPGSNRQEASQAVLLDFMEDNTVKAYRISFVRSKAEGEGIVYLYEPWIIDPDDMNAYTIARESTTAPVWPPDAEVTVDEVGNTSAKVHFPTAQPGSDKGDDMVHEYKLVAEAEDGTTVVKRVFNDYYRPAAYIRNTWDVLFKGLVAETTYTMSVYAQTSWNKEAGSEGGGTWADSTGPAPNSTSKALVSASFTTSGKPIAPRAILDIDFRTGSNEDAMGHAANFEAGPKTVEDDALGYPVFEADGTAGWGYALASADSDQFVGASTHECYFKLVDAQADQCVFSNQQQAGCGFEVDRGQLQFWYNHDAGSNPKPSGPVAANEWVHAIATYDGENVTLYINGEQVATAGAGNMTVPSPKRYYIGADVNGENTSETQYACKAGTRVAFARIFPYAMTADQVKTAFAASKLAPAPEKLLDVDFNTVNSGAEVADACGHEAVNTGIAASAVIAQDESLGRKVFEADGKSAFGFQFGDDDYTYLGNEHALECVFMVHDVNTDQCFLSNQQLAGDGLEVAGNGDTRGKMAYWFNSNGSGTPKPAGTVTPDVWHHVMGVYSCGKVRLYLDGKMMEELDAAGGLKVPAAAARVYYVGADTSNTGTEDLVVREGSKIAYANIYSKAPSSDRVKELAAGFPIDPNAKPETFTVTYAWKDAIAPEGVALPEAAALEAGTAVTLPADPAKGSTVAGEKDGKKGTWTFEGWDAEDGFTLEADITVTGTWSFKADETVTPGGDTGDDGEKPGGDQGGSGTGDDKPSGGQGGNAGGNGGSTGNGGTTDGTLPQTGDLSAIFAGGATALGAAVLGASRLVARLTGKDNAPVGDHFASELPAVEDDADLI